MKKHIIAIVALLALAGCNNAETALASCRMEAAKHHLNDIYGYEIDCMKVAGFSERADGSWRMDASFYAFMKRIF